MLIFFVFFTCFLGQGILAQDVRTRPSPSRSFENSVFLDEDEKYQLNWEVKDEIITFEVVVDTLGWVGLGWSAKGGMADADIITGWYDANSKGMFLQDRYGTGFVKPKMDDQNDIFLEAAGEMDGYTMLRFSRKLETCDDQDRPITGDTMRMIWAYGPTDPLAHYQLYYHSTNRGTRSLRLTGNAPPAPEIPNDAQTMDFNVQNYNLPSKDTHYECRFYELPKLEKKNHVIEFRPTITPGNEGVVHHMILYRCPASVQNVTLGQSQDCGEMEQCSEPAFSWGIGGHGVAYPDHVGYPIGGDEPRLVRLEIHYDNPQMRSDIIDSSGLRLIYTPTLRKYDVGTFFVGRVVSEAHVIPPQQEKFITHGRCNKKCTDEVFETAGLDEINIIGVFPHTHLAGRAQVTRHIRQGVELEWLVKDDNYDFNYQAAVFMKDEVVFKKGDEMKVECTYESMDRTTPIFGGPSTRDEMCLSFVYYYPRTSMVACISETPQSSFSELVTKYNRINPNYDYENFVTDYKELMSNNISWPEAAPYWQDVEENYPYHQVCTFNREGIPYSYHPDQSPMYVYQSYRPPLSPCDLVMAGGSTVAVNIIALASSALFLLFSTFM